MNVLIKIELPDGATPPKVDEISLGDSNRSVKVVEVIPEPYYLNYSKGEAQVHDGAVLQITDDSKEPLKVVQKKYAMDTVGAKMASYERVDLDLTKSSEAERGIPTEKVHHPKHYNQYSVEVMSMMVRIWGEAKAKIFCELNAFKYRMRAGFKSTGVGAKTGLVDLQKEKWYLDYAKELSDEKDV